jgi:hypothetical protein
VGVKNIRRITVNCRPKESVPELVIDSGRIVIVLMAVKLVFVSAEIDDSRNGGAGRPVSRLLPLLEVPGGASSPALVGTRFRLVLTLLLLPGVLVEGSVGLDFGEDFDLAEGSRSTWIGSWILKL